MVHYLKQAPMYTRDSTEAIEQTVDAMLTAIERDGDAAIRRYSRELDGWDPEDFRVPEADIERAYETVDVQLKDDIDAARDQVQRFATAQRNTLQDLEIELNPGVTLGHRHLPVQAVGSYVPGGRYPLIASAIMTIVVPKVADVQRVVACAPPQRDGGVHPAMLYAMASSGADEIYSLGGVQAMAAMALGFEQLAPVDMIVGAGNAFVAEAKRRLFGRVGIDLLAGPTEILVIADEHADAELVAADLLGQAEHGPNSPAILITTSAELGAEVLEQVDRLLETWPTAEVAGAAWEAHGTVAVVESHEEAMRLSDQYAPEHLEVQVDAELLDAYLVGLKNYGVAVPGRGGDRRLRRQGDRHQPRPADDGRRALHRRPLGRQVPEDLHLPAPDRRGHARGSPRSPRPSRRRKGWKDMRSRRPCALTAWVRDSSELRPDRQACPGHGRQQGIGAACAAALARAARG